jgi:hypothetical protein
MYRLLLSDIKKILILLIGYQQILSKTNFMKIRLVRAELFHADRRKEAHDEDSSRFSLFREKRLIQRSHSNFHDMILNKHNLRSFEFMRHRAEASSGDFTHISWKLLLSFSLRKAFPADLKKPATAPSLHILHNLYHHFQNQLDISYALRKVPQNSEAVVLLNT